MMQLFNELLITVPILAVFFCLVRPLVYLQGNREFCCIQFLFTVSENMYKLVRVGRYNSMNTCNILIYRTTRLVGEFSIKYSYNYVFFFF